MFFGFGGGARSFRLQDRKYSARGGNRCIMHAYMILRIYCREEYTPLEFTILIE